jgi:hypothetical protein
MASVKDRIAALSEAQPRSPPKDQPFPVFSPLWVFIDLLEFIQGRRVVSYTNQTP